MEQQQQIVQLRENLESTILGQDKLLDRLIISLLTGGHILVEGLPGLAKTSAIKALAAGVHASFQRIQFTPDLLPGDLTGSEIYNPDNRSFEFRHGPLFHEIVLADEINRAPAKVQSALLEAMQEHQVTIAGVTRELPPLFMVMATQNPLELAGTYALPEAQLDRFMLHVVLDYPAQQHELEILRRERGRLKGEISDSIQSPLTVDAVLAAREEVTQVHIAPELEQYIVELVNSTRHVADYLPEHAGHVQVGASPRAMLSIARAAAAEAYLRARDYVLPEDILEVAADCLRHRIILSVQGQMQKISSDELLAKLIDKLAVP